MKIVNTETYSRKQPGNRLHYYVVDGWMDGWIIDYFMALYQLQMLFSVKVDHIGRTLYS